MPTPLLTRSDLRLALGALAVALLASCGTDPVGTGDPDAAGLDVDGDGGSSLDGSGNPTLDVGGDGEDDGGTDDTATPDAGDDTDDGGGSTDPRPGGGDCAVDSDCPPATFCDTRFGAGYCAPVPDASGSACSSDAECDLADSDDVFCCSDFFGSRQCTRAGSPEDGATCGAAAGEQATPCADGGQSDCGPNQYCLFAEQPYAYCSEVCDPANDGCPDGSACFETGSGAGLCLEYGETPDYEACGADPTGCGPGRFCIEPDPARPELSYCAAACETDRDCADGDACTEFGVCQPDGARGEGESCVEDRFDCEAGLFCYSYGGRAAICTTLCQRDRDCDSGSVCQIYDPAGDTGLCVPEGDRAPGEFCGDDPTGCAAGLCFGALDTFDPNAYCIASCAETGRCDAGTRCEAGYCLPDGDGTQGASCVLDPLSCAEGHFCLGAGGSLAFCAAACGSDADCAAGTWCSGGGSESGACIPDTGTLAPGEDCTTGSFDECAPGSFCADSDSVCIAECTGAPESCPADQACVEFNPEGGRSFCYPYGSAGYGESCADDIRGCEPGLYCVGRGTPGAVCASTCAGDADCPAGDRCYDGACVASGSLDRNADCSAEPFGCDDGLACLLGGQPGSFCAGECTGFAASCGADEACRFVGYGRNFCVPAGDGGHGSSCADDRFACDDASWCVGAGTDTAVCVQTCSFDAESCPDGTSCRFLPGGLGLCVSAGLNPVDPLNPGGAPL